MLNTQAHRTIVSAVSMIIEALGHDLQDPTFKGTPARVAELYSDILDGNFIELGPQTKFPNTGPLAYEGMVAVHKVPFYAFCAHHMLPFQGHFGMAYIPDENVLGLSKLVRIFRHHCKRLTTQEELTKSALTSLCEAIQPQGAAIYVVAEHMCMTLRGVKSPGSLTTTMDFSGMFKTTSELRQIFIEEARK